MLEGCTPFPADLAERYVREGYWRSEAIAQACAAAARAHQGNRPAALALADSARRMGFGELMGEAERFAGVLAHHGIARGDRIVIQLPNCIEFVSVFLACMELGVIPVMALPAFRCAELRHLVSFTNARAIAIAPEHRGFDHSALARELKSELPCLESIFATGPAAECIWLHQNAGTPHPIGASIGDPFDATLFLLSGGTTGLPKLIPRTHADYLFNARACAELSSLDESSRILLALPVEHNFPLACPGLLGSLLCGASAVLTQSAQASDLAHIIEREQITHLPCVPTKAMALLELPARERECLRSLRVISVGGQRLQEPTARALRKTFPRVTVQQVFGMAEGLICMTRMDDPEDEACTTQGRPVCAADEIRIVDERGAEARAGELGELWCRGPYTIRGYFNAPERNPASFTPDGFFKTGDLVRRHRSGNLVVEGRLKDAINRGGEKISAEEVEAHLLEHPAVASAAVIAMPDATLGERACAYVVLRPGVALGIAAMRDFLAARGVAKFKWPERVEVIEKMPLTNVGKIKKAELRSDIERKLAAEGANRLA